MKSGNAECVYITSDVGVYMFIDSIPLHLIGSLIQSCKSHEWKELFKVYCDQIVTTRNIKIASVCDKVQYWMLNTKDKKGYGVNKSGGNLKENAIV